MENIEYEHSFNVESIDPFINYCENNGYKKITEQKQNRIVYENKGNNRVIARLTTQTEGDEQVTILDFKNVGEKRRDLKISTESLPIIVTNENRAEIESLLSVLEFFMAANNVRIRHVYEKGGVKFEIDNYIIPQNNVVAIEGERSKVERVYSEIIKLCGEK